MTRLFLDTNIVVDLLERREPFCQDAVKLFTMAYNKQVQLVVSPMTYSTASFLLRKHKSAYRTDRRSFRLKHRRDKSFRF